MHALGDFTPLCLSRLRLGRRDKAAKTVDSAQRAPISVCEAALLAALVPCIGDNTDSIFHDDVASLWKCQEPRQDIDPLALKERDVPEYIEVDFKKMTAKFKRIPELSDVPYPAIMEPNLVVEYYAKN